MKRSVVIAIVAAAFLFIQCGGMGDMNNPENRESVVPVEELRISTINGNWTEETPLVTDPSKPVEVKGIGEARKNVRVVIFPVDAPYGVTCKSDNSSSIYFDHNTFQIVGKAPGAAKLTFTSLGKMKNGKHATAEVYVKSSVMDINKVIRWEFSRLPEGWVSGSSVVTQPNNVPYADRDGKGYDMELLSSSRSMSINTSSKGLRIGGSGNFARIAGIQGPYNMTITFALGGGDGTDDRWPEVRIGSVTHNGNHALMSSKGGGRKTLEITHTGTSADTITLWASGNIWIYDVIMELLN